MAKERCVVTMRKRVKVKQEEVRSLCLCVSCLLSDALLLSPVSEQQNGLPRLPYQRIPGWAQCEVKEGRVEGERIGESKVISRSCISKAPVYQVSLTPGSSHAASSLVPTAQGSHVSCHIIPLCVISLAPIASFVTRATNVLY